MLKVSTRSKSKKKEKRQEKTWVNIKSSDGAKNILVSKKCPSLKIYVWLHVSLTMLQLYFKSLFYVKAQFILDTIISKKKSYAKVSYRM